MVFSSSAVVWYGLVFLGGSVCYGLLSFATDLPAKVSVSLADLSLSLRVCLLSSSFLCGCVCCGLPSFLVAVSANFILSWRICLLKISVLSWRICLLSLSMFCRVIYSIAFLFRSVVFLLPFSVLAFSFHAVSLFFLFQLRCLAFSFPGPVFLLRVVL